MSKSSLLDIIEPQPNSTILIYDVHASESGALAVLDDLYIQIKDYPDRSIKWLFAISTPHYQNTDTITVRRYPWVKKNWGYRLYFDNVTTRKLVKQYKPDKVFSLQNKGISFFKGHQYVYLHFAFVLTDYRFDIKKDGKRLWLYQNVLSKGIFASLRKVDRTIVQTRWMKDALIEKAGVDPRKIVIDAPDISMNNIGTFVDMPENRKRFFYPATAFNYKNHETLLKAVKYAVENGLKDYEVIFTLKKDENSYTKLLYSYVNNIGLNVKFIGTIPREKVFELYTKSVLLFPSFVESFGMPLLEGKMSNTFVIASDCSFSREILDGYDKALFFGPHNYKEMARHMLNVAADGVDIK